VGGTSDPCSAKTETGHSAIYLREQLRKTIFTAAMPAPPFLEKLKK